MRRLNVLAAAVSVAVGLVYPSAAGAAPMPPARAMIFTDSWNETEEGIDLGCGTPSVDVAYSGSVRAVLVPHANGLLYATVLVALSESYTADDVTVVSSARFVDKELQVTENEDGTYTIVQLSTGNATIYGPDGKAIARNPGQFRFVYRTHADDDGFDVLEVLKSTGRSDDFCTAITSVFPSAGQ